MAFLNSTGLDYFWDKIVAKINSTAKTTVDTAMSNTSTNPVQNKVINEAIEEAKNEVLQLANDYTDSKTQAISNNDIDTTCT